MIEFIVALTIVFFMFLPPTVAVGVAEDTKSDWLGLVAFFATWFVIGSVWVLLRSTILS